MRMLIKTIVFLMMNMMFFYQISQAGIEDVKTTLNQFFREQMETTVDQQALLGALEKVDGFTCTVLKSSRWDEDAVIFKLSNQTDENAFCVKIHPESFPLCSHIYRDDLISVINKTQACTQVSDSFLVGPDQGKYRVVIYPFVKGQPLGQALEAHMINEKEAVEKIFNIVDQLNQGKMYLVLRDINDFLLTDDGTLILTDWNTLVDVNQATEESIRRYMPFKKRCIEGFVNKPLEYDMSTKSATL